MKQINKMVNDLKAFVYSNMIPLYRLVRYQVQIQSNIIYFKTRFKMFLDKNFQKMR